MVDSLNILTIMIRSQEMSLSTLVFTEESTWDTMNLLAFSENIMFTDQQSFARNKKNQKMDAHSAKMLKRCEELLSMYEFITPKFNEFQVKLSSPKLSTKFYIKNIDKYCVQNNYEPRKYFEFVETYLKSKFETLQELIKNLRILNDTRNNLVETQSAFKELDTMLPSGMMSHILKGEYPDIQQSNLLADKPISNTSKMFQSIIGFIETKYLLRILILINRISKDLVEIRTKNLTIEDQLFQGNDYSPKTLVVIYFVGKGQSIIRDKITAALQNYNFNFLNFQNLEERHFSQSEIEQSLKDNKEICHQSEDRITFFLKTFAEENLIANVSDYHVFLLVIKREYKFAQNLIYLRHKNGFNQLLLWTPVSSLVVLRENLESLGTENFAFAKPKLIAESFEDNELLFPPSLFSTNSLIYPSQEIVNIYGIPKYREINPAIFTIISLPFFYGLMFGDIGHGFILLLFAVFCYFNHSQKLHLFKSISTMMILMGTFSIYCGLIYNQFFSVPFVTQVGCYNPSTFISTNITNCHPIGIDWVWEIAKNATPFLNSFKMKFAIIIGVLQMILGLLLKITNAIFFKRYLDLVFEAIPQIIFLLSIFGYMCVCIVVKWLTSYVPGKDVSIINLFINLPKAPIPLFGAPGVQEKWQVALLSIAGICAFLMYFPKPIIIFLKQKYDIKYQSSAQAHSDEEILDMSMSIIGVC